MAVRCFTNQDAELYDRGYPHLVQLVDEPEKPVPLAKLYDEYSGAYQHAWPRSTARAFVRANAVVDDLELDSDEAAAAGAKSGEIDDAEAGELIRAMLAKTRRDNTYADEYWLFCLEALVGTDPVLALLARELVALPWERISATDEQLQAKGHEAVWPLEDAVPGKLAYTAGYLLLRASPSAATAARKTLEALWQRLVDAHSVLDEQSVRGGLDLALHGMDGAQRVLADSHWQYLYWWGFVTDTEMIARRYGDSMKSEFDPDPRLAWLGGEKILELTCSKKLVRTVGKRRRFFFEQIGKFDHPAVRAMMEEWSDDKRAGDVARQWFVDHDGATWVDAPATATKPAKAAKPAAKVAKKPAPKPKAKPKAKAKAAPKPKPKAKAKPKKKR